MTALVPLTVALFRKDHPDTRRSDAQIQWYCDLDALVLRAYEIGVPGEQITRALQGIAETRLGECADDLASLVAEADEGLKLTCAELIAFIDAHAVRAAKTDDTP